jgi:UDP-N-acetylmuramyl pentapeptide phosphotransferase/UDP-N-acetylglucosamine-1-phosphate transferase
MEIRYLYVFIILVIVAFLYYRLALYFKIVDKPNFRSSHEFPTVRGGGILFPFAVLLWWLFTDFQYTWMLLGLLIISGFSLADDIMSLSRRLRLGGQLLAISLLFYELEIFTSLPLWALPILYILCLGIINAVNFMDGINGITGLYAMIFFGTLVLIREWLQVYPFSLSLYTGIAVFIFLFFNFRNKKAIMFAGDIGSISLAFIMIFLMLKIYLETGNWTVILLLLIYGVDAVITIIQRLLKKENIFDPHRAHLYQYLSNQLRVPHLYVASGYALVQFMLNFFLIIRPESFPDDATAILVSLGMGMIYLGVKYWVIRKTDTTTESFTPDSLPRDT